MFLFLHNAMPSLISSSAQPSFPQLPLCLVWGHRIPGCRSPRPSCPSSRSLFSVSGYHSKLFICKSGVPLSGTDLYPNSTCLRIPVSAPIALSSEAKVLNWATFILSGIRQGGKYFLGHVIYGQPLSVRIYPDF